jgi:hypothetical protein
VRWGQRAFGRGKLHGAERECRHRRERMHLGGERRSEQRRKRHGISPNKLQRETLTSNSSAIMARWCAPLQP